MITEQQKLDLLLKAEGATILGITPGDRDDVTPEEVAKAIRKSILAVRKNSSSLRDVDLSI